MAARVKATANLLNVDYMITKDDSGNEPTIDWNDERYAYIWSKNEDAIDVEHELMVSTTGIIYSFGIANKK